MVSSFSNSTQSASVAVVSGAGLRSRKVDKGRPLAVIRESDIPDLGADSEALNRVVSTVSTGVEKDEEEEHHLQVALSSNQAGVAATSVFIPTPDASTLIQDYSLFYSPTFHPPKSYISFSSVLDDVIGCPYNMDADDDKWLSKQKADQLLPDYFTDDLYEVIIWTMERLANEKLTGECPSYDEYLFFLEIEQPALLQHISFLPIMYERWKTRRFTIRGGKQITPQLKYEDVLINETDPYVCFRRREVKTTMRKTRRCDSQSLDKLRKLRDELQKARDILELVSSRERLRKESAALEIDIFEERIKVRKMKKLLGVMTAMTDADASPEKKKKKQRSAADGGGGASGGVGSSSGGGAFKIKIPIRKASNNSDMTGGGVETFDTATIEERIKRRRFLDDREGWFDFSENPYLSRYQSSQSSDRWTTDLPISFSSSPTRAAASSLSSSQPTTSLHPPPHQQLPPSTSSASSSSQHPHNYTTRDSQGHPILFRRRIGRGGRLIIDRHVRRSSLLADLTSNTLSSFSSSQQLGGKSRPALYDQMDDPHLASSSREEAEDRLARMQERLRYDIQDDLEDDDDAIELNDNWRFMTYRAFNLAPFSEQECRTVMNRPTFPDQINIQPLSQQQRLHQMQMQQQQRQEMLAKNQAALAPNPSSASGGAAAGGSGGGSATTSGSQKKRASRPSTGGADSKGATPSNNKKKVQEPLDPRQAAVKAMIAQAAKNAQSTQAQLSGQSPRMSIDGGQPSAMMAGSASSPPNTGGGLAVQAGNNPAAMAAAAAAAAAKIPMNPNMANLINNATPQQRLMIINQIRMQQQMQQMQQNGMPPGFGQLGAAPNINVAGMSPQQIHQVQQRMYQYQLQQNAIQNQLRMGGFPGGAGGGGAPGQMNPAQFQAQLQFFQQQQQQQQQQMLAARAAAAGGGGGMSMQLDPSLSSFINSPTLANGDMNANNGSGDGAGSSSGGANNNNSAPGSSSSSNDALATTPITNAT